MADVTLQVHYITNGLGGGGNYLTGQYIRVIADLGAIRAELWDAPEGGNFISNPSGGPDLTGEPGQITVSSGVFSNFQYCDGSDLKHYNSSLIWPYAEFNTTADHPSCAIVVCDLEITGATATNETTTGAADGEIALTATSSNGGIEFSLDPDFVFGTGSASPLTGFSTGNYTVYAKDAAGCEDLVIVFVGLDFTYGPRWRCEYDAVLPRGFLSRIDIEERDYVGAVEEVYAGEEPFELEYIPADDSQLVPSTALIQLEVPRGEEHKFDDIRIGFDRQFLCKKYKDTSGTGLAFQLEWVGYITPEFYTEPYYHEPYIITLKAIDGIGELKEKDFIAASGEEYFGNMSVIQIVSECVKKIPFELNIRSCVNIFEEGMNTTADDDPLAQVYVRAQNYRGMKCGAVLTDILKPFTRAELFQSLGVYWIRTKEQSVYTNLPYREFDVDGVYVEEDSINARKNLDYPRQSSRFKWHEKSQNLNYSRNYGTFKVTHNLDKDNNMIDSGSFELIDIDPATEFYRNWQIFPVQTNVTSGLEYTDNLNTKAAFFFQWANNANDQANNILASSEFPIHVVGNVFEKKGTNFHLFFKVWASPSFDVKWVWFGWKLRFIDTDTGDFYDWAIPNPEYTPLAPRPDANEEKINDIYISSFNTFNNYEFKGFRLPGDIDAINFTCQLLFYFHNHKGRDYDTADDMVDFDGLRAFVTNLAVVPVGKRFYVAHDDDTYGYELQKNTDAEDPPNIIRPDDYNATTNPYQWVKIALYNQDGTVPMLGRIMIDDVKIQMFDINTDVETGITALVDPPETVVYENVVTDRNESIFNDEVKCGDAPDLTCFEYIYNGFFMLSDETATQRWARQGITESRYLLDIYLGHISAQGWKSLRLLTGVGAADIQLGYINSLEDQRDDRRYRFKRFKFKDKHGMYDIELEETLTGADGESPPDAESITFDSTLHEFSETDITWDGAN